MKALFAW